MAQHAAQSAPSRSIRPASTPRQALQPAPDPDGKLLDGVAAQDALVALFDDDADEEPPEMRRGLIRAFRQSIAPAKAIARGVK